eukprot:795149-Rhodomonas_salina.3
MGFFSTPRLCEGLCSALLRAQFGGGQGSIPAAPPQHGRIPGGEQPTDYCLVQQHRLRPNKASGSLWDRSSWDRK